MSETFDEADHYSQAVGAVYEAADRSRSPLRTEHILDLAAQYGCWPESLALDVGCANGGNTRQLIAMTGCRVEGVDLLPHLVEMGERENREAGLKPERFRIRQGSILEIPFPDNHFDFVFCRDMLSGVEPLSGALAECHRVLKPGRHMLVYVTLPTPLMSEAEAADFHQGLGSGSLAHPAMSEALAGHFQIVHQLNMGSQGVQAREEAGDRTATNNLLRIARVQTWREEFEREHGARVVQIALADLKHQVFMLMGKLEGRVYVLKKAGK